MFTTGDLTVNRYEVGQVQPTQQQDKQTYKAVTTTSLVGIDSTLKPKTPLIYLYISDR